MAGKFVIETVRTDLQQTLTAALQDSQRSAWQDHSQ